MFGTGYVDQTRFRKPGNAMKSPKVRGRILSCPDIPFSLGNVFSVLSLDLPTGASLGQQLRLGSDHRALAHIHSSLRWTSCVRSRNFRKNSPDKLQLCEVFGPGSLASLQQHVYGWIGVAYWGQVCRIFSHTQPPRLGVQIDYGRCPRQPDAPQVPQISSHGHEQVSGTPSVRTRVGRSQR